MLPEFSIVKLLFCNLLGLYICRGRQHLLNALFYTEGSLY